MSALHNIADALLIFCDGLEAQIVTLRRELKKLGNLEQKQDSSQTQVSFTEDRFNSLTWKDENGVKLGPYQIALIQNNNECNWNHVYNFLKNKSTTIGNRFHKETYQHSYWLYDKMDYKIFRQKLRDPKK